MSKMADHAIDLRNRKEDRRKSTPQESFNELKRDVASMFAREPEAIKLVRIILDRAFILGQSHELNRQLASLKK